MSPARLEEQALRFALASRLTSYPDAGFRPAVDELLSSGAVEPATSALLSPVAQAGDLDTVRSEYLALFDHGPDRTPLYETEYGRMRGMSKGPELADICGFYRAFGLLAGDGDEHHEMADHLGVELEFYSVLLARQARLHEEGNAEGQEIVEDARRKFLVDHLGRFAPAIAARANVARSPLYGPVFSWAGALVLEQCGELGVTPSALDFHSLEAAPAEDACCGDSHQLPQLKAAPAQ